MMVTTSDIFSLLFQVVFLHSRSIAGLAFCKEINMLILTHWRKCSKRSFCSSWRNLPTNSTWTRYARTPTASRSRLSAFFWGW